MKPFDENAVDQENAYRPKPRHIKVNMRQVINEAELRRLLKAGRREAAARNK